MGKPQKPKALANWTTSSLRLSELREGCNILRRIATANDPRHRLALRDFCVLNCDGGTTTRRACAKRRTTSQTRERRGGRRPSNAGLIFAFLPSTGVVRTPGRRKTNHPYFFCIDRPKKSTFSSGKLAKKRSKVSKVGPWTAGRERSRAKWPLSSPRRKVRRKLIFSPLWAKFDGILARERVQRQPLSTNKFWKFAKSTCKCLCPDERTWPLGGEFTRCWRAKMWTFTIFMQSRGGKVIFRAKKSNPRRRVQPWKLNTHFGSQGMLKVCAGISLNARNVLLDAKNRLHAKNSAKFEC